MLKTNYSGIKEEREMATINLINLNVDTLFAQQSVVEIDAVSKKIQEVVENKREELRTMVGERYRDLLKAADTITEMQGSTKELITQVESIESICKNLNEQQLLGFKNEPDNMEVLKLRNANKQLNHYFSTMIQIKLLTSLPELMWSQLDREQYYAATELFIFSRHISTGLQLDTNNPLIKILPVAKKQWEIIKPFHMTIKQRVMSALERYSLGPEITVDCVLSILQIDRCTLESALKTFLNLRCNAFLNCLNSDCERVKDRILSSFRILNDSLDMVGKCFIDDGLLFRKISEYNDQNTSTIMRMYNNEVQFPHFLPDIILNFKPKFDAIVVNNNSIRSLLEQFLIDTERITSIQLKQLFDLVTHMSSIQDIKKEANNIRNQVNVNALITHLQLTPSLDLYELRYVPLINQRIRNIINDSWSKAINESFFHIENSLKQLDIQDRMHYSLWQEFPSDLPNSLDQALSEDLKIKKLLMKTMGYNWQIIEIVSEFDNNLSVIIKEMNVLLEEPTTKIEDKLGLVEYLHDTALQHITECISKIKALEIEKTRRLSLLFVARCCSSLVELCPYLRMCFCHSSSWRQLLGKASSSTSGEYWQRICGLMEDEAFKYWLQLVDGLLEEFSCDRYLANINSFNVILEDFTKWDLITVEQQDDEDMTVQSSFRIPTQPCISLLSFLQNLITSLKVIVPETLPIKVLQAFNHKLIDKLIKHYEKLLYENPNVTQNIALQLYFDVKFLQNSFNITRQQKEDITTLQNRYKDLIDPFDFELFSSQLIENIKRSVLRSNCILGVLTSLNMPTSQSGTVVQEKDANVLSLCSSGSTSLWFPLLPVVSTVATNSMENKKDSSNESPKDSLYDT